MEQFDLNWTIGPTKSKIVFTVEKGVPFKVLEKKGSWLRIEVGGMDGRHCSDQRELHGSDNVSELKGTRANCLYNFT